MNLNRHLLKESYNYQYINISNFLNAILEGQPPYFKLI